MTFAHGGLENSWINLWIGEYEHVDTKEISKGDDINLYQAKHNHGDSISYIDQHNMIM